MDEYQLEMREIQHRIHELEAKRGDPVILDELEGQLRILRSFYDTALRVLDRGENDQVLRRGLAAMGFGAWNLQNVYSLVYETAMEIEPGRRELSSLIPEVDFESMLRERAG